METPSVNLIDPQPNINIPANEILNKEIKNDGYFISLSNNISNTVSNNQIYIYIGIGVLILAVILYYFYIKNKKETLVNTDTKTNQPPQLPLQQAQDQENNQIQEQLLQQQHQIMYLQQQLQQQQQQQPPQTNNRLIHQDESSEINNIDLMRIQSNENDNIAQHNLTNAELEEINQKLEMLNKN